MSLQSKYTWHQFLKENPNLKEKGIKRTSDEGKKAFEAAREKFIKTYVDERTTKIKKQVEKATSKKAAIKVKLDDATKAKKWPRVKILQKQIGKKESFIVKTNRWLENNSKVTATAKGKK